MKRSSLFFGMVVLAFLAFTTSCKKDEPNIGDGGGIPVSDGFYMAMSGADPDASAALKAETVAADNFGSQARDGFFAGYMYLKAGNYNVVNVVEGKIIETYGGSIETITQTDASQCGYDDIDVASVALDGAAFAVSADGLYKVMFDKDRSEVVLHKIEKVGLIGDATVMGWGGDVDLPLMGNITADSAVWEGTEIQMKQGQFKIRFNCRWVIDRLIDSGAGLDPTNGYMAFTNFGGSPDNLIHGNDAGNMEIDANSQAQYTVTVKWTPADGFTMTMTRTGDYVPPAFNPDDHPWGVRGTAGIDWSTGIKLFYKSEGSAHTWVGMIQLSENAAAGDGSGEFKITDGNTWLGVNEVTDNTNGLLEGTDNLIVKTGNGGFYYIVVTTTDEGTTYTADIYKGQWSIIGNVVTGTNWDSDLVMTENGSDFTVTNQAFDAGEFKFRANADWRYNLGGDMAALSVDGANLSISAGGTYTITLTTQDKGETWSATIQ